MADARGALQCPAAKRPRRAEERARRFVGDRLRLNRLKGVEPAAGPHALDEVSMDELFGERQHLQAACLASYGVDYALLDSMLHGSPADADGSVIVVDNDDEHYRHHAGFDAETHPRRVVVLPPFHAEDSTPAERLRARRGCMHPKLMLLAFDERGADDEHDDEEEGATPNRRWLRVVISSANIGRYDAKINNQFWVHDFPARRAEPRPPPRAPLEKWEGRWGPASRVRAPLAPLAIAADSEDDDDDDAAAARNVAAGEAAVVAASGGGKLVARRSGAGASRSFGDELFDFVRAMLEPTATARPDLQDTWRNIFDEHDMTPPAGIHLIPSVPGRYSRSSRERYGQWALARHLKAGLRGQPRLRIEFACSSCGKVHVTTDCVMI